MKTHFLTMLLFIPGFSYVFGQQRISFDVNVPTLTYTSALFTSNYMSVTRHKFFWSVGIELGGYGYSAVDGRNRPEGMGLAVRSPYDEVAETVIRDTLDYQLRSYTNRVKGLGISGGFGRFFNFGHVHGLRIEALFRWLYVDNKIEPVYYNAAHKKGFLRSRHVQHSALAFNAQVYHTIRLSGRATFYYGLKIPFFMNPVGKYHPQYRTDVLNGVKPQLTLGLTWLLNNKSCFVKEE